MIKKRYLAILSVAIISVLLGSLYHVTFAGKPTPQPEQVEVINFPPDQNVTVTNFPTLVEPKVIVVVQNARANMHHSS